MEKPEAYRLFSFVPTQFETETIHKELRPLLPRCCQCEAISVRIPQGIEAHPDNLEWHQDSGGKAGTARHMIVWASESPTNIKDSDGNELHFEPFDVIWLNNDEAFHRQPRGANELSRWFLAVRCSGEIL